MHSGKAQLHSGEDPPTNPHLAKASFPSVENRALGEGFAECRAGTRERFDTVGRRPTPFSFFYYFLSRVNTRGRFLNFFLNNLCRVPQLRHSGKPPLKILFFCFFLFHVNNKAYIYHKPQINNNISQTTFIYHKRPNLGLYDKHHLSR